MMHRIGFGGRLFVMTSSGASIVPETARRFPVRALESGPAAGALMSAHHGRKLGFPDLLSFDMGGTTAKGALVRGFTALKQYDLEVGRVQEFKSGSGLPVKLPVIDMIEIEVALPDGGTGARTRAGSNPACIPSPEPIVWRGDIPSNAGTVATSLLVPRPAAMMQGGARVTVDSRRTSGSEVRARALHAALRHTQPLSRTPDSGGGVTIAPTMISAGMANDERRRTRCLSGKRPER